MAQTILVVEGEIANLGIHSTNEYGITTWDAIRVRKENGQEIFIPKNKTDPKIGSYISDSLGKSAKIFYSEYAIGKSKEAAIFAIQFADGTSFDRGQDLDREVKKVKRMIFGCWGLLIISIVIGLCFVMTMLLAFVAIPFFWAAWKIYKGIKVLSNVLENFPSTKSFQEFYANHRTTLVAP
jgi:hypothetical protein